MTLIHPFAKQILDRNERKLYRYTSFNAEFPESIFRIFTHQELYFPSPKQLNDPFEFKILIRPPVLNNFVDKWKSEKEARKLLKRNGTQRKEIYRRSHAAMNSEFMVEQAASLTELLPHEWDSMRICSFSSSCNSLLLWAHYAGSHSGICLIFDADSEDFGLAFQVKYSDDYPTMDYYDREPGKLFKLVALTKASEWSYEHEFRLLTKEPQLPNTLPVVNHIYKFPKERLLGVILGCEISTENENRIRELVSGYGHSLKLLRSRKLQNKYAIEIVESLTNT